MNELIDLVQRIDSIMDDSKGEVISVGLGSSGPSVHLSFKTFLSEHSTFDIMTFDHISMYPYRFNTDIDGVEIKTYMSATEIVDLKQTNPDAWEFIQNEIQKEVV